MSPWAREGLDIFPKDRIVCEVFFLGPEQVRIISPRTEFIWVLTTRLESRLKIFPFSEVILETLVPKPESLWTFFLCAMESVLSYFTKVKIAWESFPRPVSVCLDCFFSWGKSLV